MIFGLTGVRFSLSWALGVPSSSCHVNSTVCVTAHFCLFIENVSRSCSAGGAGSGSTALAQHPATAGTGCHIHGASSKAAQMGMFQGSSAAQNIIAGITDAIALETLLCL